MVNVPATTDCIQTVEGILETPEIRVWCHPHYIDEPGSDYYKVFDNFIDAVEFIKNHKESEPYPLIAYGGYELNIFKIERKQK